MKGWKLIEKGKLQEFNALSDAGNASTLIKVRVLKVGVSTSTVRLFKGEEENIYPIVPCKQAVGVVVSIPDEETTIAKGDRVVISPYISCGECFTCKNGEYRNCPNKKIMGLDENGVMQDFIFLKRENLYILPQIVSDDEAIFTSYLATALHAIDRLNVKKGQTIIIGSGGILGSLIAQLCIFYQAIPILIDNRQDNLMKAKKLGIFYATTENEKTQKQVAQITSGKMADGVIFISDYSMSLKNCFKYVAQNGSIGLVSLFSGKLNITAAQILEKEVSIVPIKPSDKFFTKAINLLANKNVDVIPLINRTVNFSQFDSLMNEMAAIHNENASVYQNIVIID